VTIEEGYVERLNGISPPPVVEPLLSEEYQTYYRQFMFVRDAGKRFNAQTGFA